MFPIDPAIRKTVDEAVRCFVDAGAEVEEVRLDLKRDQRELSNAWTRLMGPLDVGALEGMKAFGIDLMGQHRDDFPPAYLERIDASRTLSAIDLARDQTIRSEVYDAIQGVLAAHEILVCPTLAAMPVDNAANGDTQGPPTSTALKLTRSSAGA